MIRVVLPAQLRTLARIEGDVLLEAGAEPTAASVLDVLEARYPVLRGAIRDRITHKRRAYVRFFACSCDLSHEASDVPLPAAVARGDEPFLIVGAMSGG